MQPSIVYCDTCGIANRPQARFCIACGQAMPIISSLLPTVQAGPAPSSPPLTGLLPANSLLKECYLILSRLGQGGMGAVYKAADTQLGNRLVAVKEMGQKGLDAQETVAAAAAFKHEAHMLAGLPHHPHLPSMYNHFEDGGRWYLVMDFIAGETLEEHLAKAGGTLPVEEVLDIGMQLCTVLSDLHTHHSVIIFRDLKPANVMRTASGDLFLINFGIARHFKHGHAVAQGYAAPEQYGHAQTTPQSDIYSLGATLHQLLTGLDPSQSPFRFAPLSGGIPAGLGTLIVQMVDMDAEKRPASMAEIKQELQRIATALKVSQLAPTQYGGSPSLPPTHVASVSQPTGTTLSTYRGHADSVFAVAWSPDGRRIASGSADETMQVWDAVGGDSMGATGSNAYIYGGHCLSVHAVAWSPDGRYIASGGYDKTVQIWDAATGDNAYTYGGHSDIVFALAWSPDGKRIASGGYDKTVQVWDAVGGDSVAATRGHVSTYGHAETVRAVAWSPDGRYIASGSEDHTVQIWDATTGGNVYTYGGHSHRVYTVAWSPDGKRIASGSFDMTVQVWDAVRGDSVAATGGNIFTYGGHSHRVYTVAWSPDGRRIASGSWDETVQVWDAVGGNVFTYGGHSSIVDAVAWSPDGRRIASGSRDTTVQVWVAE